MLLSYIRRGIVGRGLSTRVGCEFYHHSDNNYLHFRALAKQNAALSSGIWDVPSGKIYEAKETLNINKLFHMQR